MQELRSAIRNICNKPIAATVSILTFALGIGANVALFTVIDAVLRRPSDIKSLDRIVVAREEFRGLGLEDIPMTPASFELLAKNLELFDATGATSAVEFVMTGLSEPVIAAGAQTMGEFFGVFRAEPFLGHLYGPAEEQSGLHLVTVLSYRFWQRIYAGNTQVIGQLIDLNGNHYRIIGVLPRSFHYPGAADVFTPLPVNQSFCSACPADRRRAGNIMTAYAHLRTGLAFEEASARVKSIGIQIRTSLGVPLNLGYGLRAVPLTHFWAGQLRSVLGVLAVVTILVLLVACANVSSLQLIRANRRAIEFSIRSALGASRWTIVRLVLVENCALSAAGAIVGIAVAFAGVAAISSTTLLKDYQSLQSLSPNIGALIAGIALTLTAGIGSGVIPAYAASRPSAAALREGKATLDRHRSRTLLALPMLQLGGAFMLLVACILSVKSSWRMMHVYPGFNAEGVVTAQLTLPQGLYESSNSYITFFRLLDERLQKLPQLQPVGLISELPFSGLTNSNPVVLLDAARNGRGDAPVHADMRRVNDTYFRTMGVPLIQGRLFDSGDRVGSPLVAIVDQQFAKRQYPGESPIGKRIRQGRSDAIIVGVVGSVVHDALDNAPKETVYYSARQTAARTLFLASRAPGNRKQTTGLIRAAVADIDSSVAVHNVETMDERLNHSMDLRRLTATGMGLFALLATALALVGVYGVLTYSLSYRTKEIGIRKALGAPPISLFTRELATGMMMTGAGIILGLVGALTTGPILAAMFYGVMPHDIPALFAATAVIAIAGCLTALVPAFRAVHVDPSVTLRHE